MPKPTVRADLAHSYQTRQTTLLAENEKFLAIGAGKHLNSATLASPKTTSSQEHIVRDKAVVA
jgi:hypothetical protein